MTLNKRKKWVYRYQGKPFNPEKPGPIRKAACNDSVAVLGLRICWDHPGGSMGLPLDEFYAAGRGSCKVCHSVKTQYPTDLEELGPNSKASMNASVATLGLKICWGHAGGPIGLPIEEFTPQTPSCRSCVSPEDLASSVTTNTNKGAMNDSVAALGLRICWGHTGGPIGLPIEEFTETGDCKECTQARWQVKYDADPVSFRQVAKDYRANNPVAIKANDARACAKKTLKDQAERSICPERLRKKARDFYARHQPRIRKAYNKARRERYANDPAYRQSTKIRTCMGRDLKLCAELHAQGISISELIRRTGVALPWYEAGLADAKAKGLVEFERDHIVPFDLLRFLGYTNPIVLFHPENCQALVKSDNSTKNNKVSLQGLVLFKKFRPDILDVFFQWGDDYGWHGPRPDEEVA